MFLILLYFIKKCWKWNSQMEKDDCKMKKNVMNPYHWTMWTVNLQEGVPLLWAAMSVIRKVHRKRQTTCNITDDIVSCTCGNNWKRGQKEANNTEQQHLIRLMTLLLNGDKERWFNDWPILAKLTMTLFSRTGGFIFVSCLNNSVDHISRLEQELRDSWLS